jgi:hypothetical protein
MASFDYDLVIIVSSQRERSAVGRAFPPAAPGPARQA